MAARTAALVQMNRWVILAGCALLTVCPQRLWLAYVPTTTQIHQLMAVSERAVGDLVGLLFVGMGVFNAVGTWLDSVLTHFGHGGTSGALIAIMKMGGVVGGALLPVIQAALGNPYLSLGALSAACLAGLALAIRLPARGTGVTREGESS